MAKMNSAPPRAYAPRVWDDSKPNPNRVKLENPERPRAAHIVSISKQFFEMNKGTKDAPNWVSVPAKYDSEGQLAPGIVPNIRIYVAFDKVKNAEKQPLKLGLKVTFSDHEKATLTKIASEVLGIPKAEVGQHDTDELIGKPVVVTCKNTNSGTTILKTIGGSADEEEQPVSATATHEEAQASTAPVAAAEEEDELDAADLLLAEREAQAQAS